MSQKKKGAKEKLPVTLGLPPKKLRPHLGIAADLGWTPVEMRNFMAGRNLQVKGTSRESILAVLGAAGVQFPLKLPPPAPAAARPVGRPLRADTVPNAIAELLKLQKLVIHRIGLSETILPVEIQVLDGVARTLAILRGNV